MDGWQVLEKWLPFLSGCAGGAAIAFALFFAFEAIQTGGSDPQYLALLLLCVACFLAGGGLILNSALEIW